jgi:hypothetical protein
LVNDLDKESEKGLTFAGDIGINPFRNYCPQTESFIERQCTTLFYIYKITLLMKTIHEDPDMERYDRVAGTGTRGSRTW